MYELRNKCVCVYSHEMRKCKNGISFYYEKVVINCIFYASYWLLNLQSFHALLAIQVLSAAHDKLYLQKNLT